MKSAHKNYSKERRQTDWELTAIWKSISKNVMFLFFFGIFFFFYFPVNAQNSPTENYLKNTGEYARIYSGMLESRYPSQLYENYPYYSDSDEFVEGEIFYKKNSYPNQKVRIDLFLENLIVITPENLHRVIVNVEGIEKVIAYNKTFLWLEPDLQSGLKPGFYISLHDGDKLKLLYKEKYRWHQKIEHGQIINHFSNSSRHYIFFENQYHTVKNTKSFTQLFPQYKKEINKFAKENKLRFNNEDKDNSLSMLANFCEKLI